MKRSLVVVCVMVAAAFFLTNAATAAQIGKMETETGKVTSVDPWGKAITISAKAGKETMDVGAVVDNDTLIKVKGKTATLRDIRVGDTVTVRYLKSDNLYAKEITKRYGS